MSGRERGKVLYRLADLMEQHADEVCILYKNICICVCMRVSHMFLSFFATCRAVPRCPPPFYQSHQHDTCTMYICQLAALETLDNGKPLSASKNADVPYVGHGYFCRGGWGWVDARADK